MMRFTLCVFAIAALAQCAPAQQEPDYWPTQGWIESAPEDQGMSSAVLEGIEPWVQANSPATKSILIVRHGHLVYEHYFRDDNRETLAQVYSVTKSFVSALVGIALNERLIPSIDATIASYYPEYFTPFVRPIKRTVTLRHCLTMTSGWEDGRWTDAPDWRLAVIRNDITSRPGTVFAYRNGPVHLLAGVIEKVTGLTAEQYARERLFEPMGIASLAWARDPQGHSVGYAGISITPRDMAKFGFLYLHGGRWDGRQLVPAAWVNESTSYKVAPSPDSGYGYLWWVSPTTGQQSDTSSEVAATGYAGQYIGIYKELDMVVVMTCAEVGMPEPKAILDQFIFPAVLDAPKQ